MSKQSEATEALDVLRAFCVALGNPVDFKNAIGALEQELQALRARAERSEAANAMQAQAFGAYVAEYGVVHEGGTNPDGCPEDDTCDCPFIVALNKAFSTSGAGAELLKELHALREQATLVQEVLGVDLASETARSELYTLGLHARETATLRSQLNSADLSLMCAEDAHRQEVDTLRAEITTLRKKVGDSQ